MPYRLPCMAILLLVVPPAAVLSADEPGDHRPHPDVRRAVVETIRATTGEVSAEELRRRPIGVFDSGTGGLTILERILAVDEFDNDTHEHGPDGRPDFGHESFLFLADQANMPYGNYPGVGRERVLDDLIVKDAQFLLGPTFHTGPSAVQPTHGKRPAKVLVIACNTATAYGQADIRSAIAEAGADVDVIGVIDAGAEGALEILADGQPGSIGVVATEGTVLAGAYPEALRRIAAARGAKQRIEIFQQGAFGLAGAIDGAREYVDPAVVDHALRAAYRGPSPVNADRRIEPASFRRYGFDFTKNRMLYTGDRESPVGLQLNSAENYLRYHLVELLEQLRLADDPPPLRALVLGCTHFPYLRETFRAELRRLYDHRENGAYVYRDLMAPEVVLVDPAVFTARRLYASLCESDRWRDESAIGEGESRSEFYITVPCRGRAGVSTDDTGGFTYEYKYGRDAGMVDADCLTVPFREGLIDRASEQRLRVGVPNVWRSLNEFRRRNTKAAVAVP